MQDAHLERLKSLLSTVRLELAAEADGRWVIRWEGRAYPVATLPLEGLDPEAEQGELLAVAAGLEAAVKAPGRLVPGESLREGSQHVLPRVERARFAEAYDAVVDGCARGPEHRLLWSDFGAGLITTYVEDEGWKFVHLVRGRYEAWQTTMGTVHSVARSNLYHREAIDHRAAEVGTGDGYDAGRAVLIDDVFYDRIGAEGAEIALPSRDLLMVAPVGGRLSEAVVAQAYAEAPYPISPRVFRFQRDRLSLRDGLVA